MEDKDFYLMVERHCVCFSCEKYACRDRRPRLSEKRKHEIHSGAGMDGEGGIAQIRGCVDSRGRLSLQKYKQKPFAYFPPLQNSQRYVILMIA